MTDSSKPRPPPSFFRRCASFLPVIFAALTVVTAEIATERFNFVRFEDQLRVSLTTRLGTLRARLEGTVYGNAQLVKSLVAVIAIEPDISQARFTALASQLFQTRSQLRNIAAAPDLVIRYMYPLEGNEAAIGLDYREVPAQREAAERARDVGEIVLAGPVDLVQGGTGLISRIPVFVSGDPPGERRFWGLVSAVIDVEALYRDSGLLAADLPIEIAIRGQDSMGADGAVFFGRKDLFAADPVVADVTLPHGSWRMAAVPKGGWPKNADNVWTIRVLFLIAGLLIVGAVIAAMNLVRERKASERAVRLSEGRLRSIMDHAPVSIFLKDRQGLLLAANQTHLQRFGLESERIIGTTIHSYTAPALADEIWRQEKLVMKTRMPQTFEITRDLPDLGERTLMIVRFPVIVDDEVIGVGGISIDVTDRTLMERQLAQAQKMEVVGQLTGGVAHDFNNLLQVIETNLELARMHVATDSQAVEFLDSALQAGHRGADLTQKLLAFSRKQTLRPQKIRTRRLIDGLVVLLSRTLGEDIRIETIRVEDHAIVADENGLTNALLNLAINARAAMPQGGTLTFAAGMRNFPAEILLENDRLPAGDYVEISVIDTGAGMSEETLNHAFEPFFTTKDVGEGSGLGLSMVHGFVRQSGGTVSMESTLGEGTRVCVLLPSAQDDDGAVDGVEALAPGDVHAMKVLLVEDDPDVRTSTAMLLRSLGCDVVEAENAAPALDLLERDSTVDLLFTDVVLTGERNGIELAQDAGRVRPDLKVILVSGYPEAELAKAGISETRYSMIGKPFSRETLSRAIRSVAPR